MKRLPALLAALLLLAVPLAAQTLESPPALIDYQGRVLDANNAPLAPAVATNYTMQFRIYSAATGGVALWGESQTVTVLNGQFSVRIGEGVALGGTPAIPAGPANLTNLFDQRDRYLGLTVVIPGQTPGEIAPRLQFLSTPYAMTANKALFAGTAAVASSIAQTAGNSTLGATTVNGSLSVAGASNRLTLAGTNVIELGSGVVGKNANAGSIGYGFLTPGVLDLVGAGTTTSNRAVKVWAEGGTTFTGAVRIAGSNVLEFGQGTTKGANNGSIGYQTFSNGLDIVGAGTSDTNRRVKIWADAGTDFTGNLTFGSRTAQHLNLWGTNYAFGVQNNTLYSRSDSRFSWFVSGAHNNAEDNPGSGGARIATLSQSNGLEIFSTKTQGSNAAITLGLDNGDIPGAEFRFRGDINDQGNPPFGSGRSVTLGYLDFTGRDGGDYDARMVVSHNRVNIGSIVQGPIVNFVPGARSTTIALQVNGTNVTLNTSCDFTLKDDIQDFAAGLDTVLALRPVDFEWRRDEFPERLFPEGRHVGLIAQELQPLVPDAVGVDAEGKLSVDFSKLVPHLVGAVQTQQAQIERLENENRALEARLARLEAAVARLAPAAP